MRRNIVNKSYLFSKELYKNIKCYMPFHLKSEVVVTCIPSGRSDSIAHVTLKAALYTKK